MASTVLGRRLTEQQRLAQVRLAQLTTVQMRQLWRLLDAKDLATTVPGWLNAAVRLVQQQYGVSAAIARRYFQALRVAETGKALPGRLPEPGFDRRPVEIALMVSGPVRIQRAIRNGEPLGVFIDRAFTESAREAGRRVLDGGRDTLIASAATDRGCLAYARATSGNACAFCQMLASRGPVYRAFRKDSSGFQATWGEFPAHAGCACTTEPMWSTDTDWPPGSREARDLYDEVAAGSADPLNEFRRAVEGRTTPEE